MNLRQAILNLATVEGSIVKVDGFLNHRVSPDVIADVGATLSSWLRDRRPDVLLTAEASGLPPAAAVSHLMGIPYIYAKKYVGPGRRYTFSREVSSPTKGMEYRVEVARHLLDPTMNVAIVDDFLWGGRTAAALVDIADEAGCKVVGAAFVIEKAMGNGRQIIEDRGVDVFAAATITNIEDGVITLAE